MLRLRSDDQLVALFRAGYDEAFEIIDARYRPRLLEYTRRMLGGSRADAEDAIQEVLFSACGALRRDDRPLMLRAWLYRIAHNRCIDHIRRPVPLAADVFDVSRTPVRDPVAEAERRENVRRVIGDVQRLPEQQRAALLMREFDGLSYAEIATVLALSQKAVKSLLVRARMGLAAAHEARTAPCADIRAELADAFGRGVRKSGRSKLHLRDCAGCREYHRHLRGLERTLSGAHPGQGLLATVAKLLGIGGAGSGAAVGAGTVAVGGPVVAKITALLCCGVAAAGVADLGPHPGPVVHAPSHHRVARTASPTTATPKAAVLEHVDRRIPPAAAPVRRRAAARPAPAAKPRMGAFRSLDDPALFAHRTTTPPPITPRAAARATGGALAPDADPPAPRAAAAPPDPPSIAPPPADPPASPPPPAATTTAVDPPAPESQPAPQPQSPPAAQPDPAVPPASAQTAAPQSPAATEPTGGSEAPSVP